MKKTKRKFPKLPPLTKPNPSKFRLKTGRPRKRPIPDHPDAKAMKRTGKYDPTRHPVETYILTAQGKSMRQVAQAFGISEEMFSETWIRKPEIAYAIERGKMVQSSSNAREEYLQFALDHLPESLRPVWERVRLLAPIHRRKPRKGQPPLQEPSLEEVRKLTGELSLRERQSLFVHAYCSDECNFIQSVACRLTGISRGAVEDWVRDDAEFRKLLSYMVEAKKDFYEYALTNLVRRGDSFAITFVNKTLNRDRGYGEKIEVINKHQVEVGFQLDRLLPLLSPAALEEVLVAIRSLDSGNPPALKEAEKVEEPMTISKG